MSSMLCSITMMECPLAISSSKDFNNFLMSWKCSPVVGSSKMNRAFSFVFPFTKKEASLMRCASPPERVEEDCPKVTYPSPTSCSGCSLPTTFSCLCVWKWAMASSMVMFRMSSMFLPSNCTSRISFLKRLPLHTSHSKCTSAINCISTVISPSPLHFSQRPPSTLNEKCLA